MCSELEVVTSLKTLLSESRMVIVGIDESPESCFGVSRQFVGNWSGSLSNGY